MPQTERASHSAQLECTRCIRDSRDHGMDGERTALPSAGGGGGGGGGARVKARAPHGGGGGGCGGFATSFWAARPWRPPWDRPCPWGPPCSWGPPCRPCRGGRPCLPVGPDRRRRLGGTWEALRGGARGDGRGSLGRRRGRLGVRIWTDRRAAGPRSRSRWAVLRGAEQRAAGGPQCSGLALWRPVINRQPFSSHELSRYINVKEVYEYGCRTFGSGFPFAFGSPFAGAAGFCGMSTFQRPEFVLEKEEQKSMQLYKIDVSIWCSGRSFLFSISFCSTSQPKNWDNCRTRTHDQLAPPKKCQGMPCAQRLSFYW